ncbi:hypothetical protein EZ449_00940 [Pedobacter frigidisoli]|uniref:Uncharacterized protein n=1 Tax=Pedobacter frigidisoli TaxID=2530455 RepID=A0A4R0P992_9SPHI|nr:hypothetical protein [Pedobacter frigidisoli]TCD12642.1 hypothetical protein EZ449_00940 [Pedobacter frigidisoli]
MEQRYTPQGYASPSAILITIAIGILASLVLPILYIILGQLIPNIWFIAIIAFLLGMGLGFFIDLGVKIGKIRNKKIAVIIAVFCGLLAFYIQWVFFDTIIYSRKGFTFNLSSTDMKILVDDFFFLFTHPNILFQEIVNLNEVGSFSIKGTGNVSGLLLWVIWAGEFIVILGGIIFAVLNGQVIKPYSEINDQWMTKRKFLNRIPVVENKELLLSELNNRNFTVLNDQPSLDNETNYAEVIVFESAGDQTKYISILNVTNPTGKAKDKKVKNVVTFYPLQNANI